MPWSELSSRLSGLLADLEAAVSHKPQAAAPAGLVPEVKEFLKEVGAAFISEVVEGPGGYARGEMDGLLREAASAGERVAALGPELQALVLSGPPGSAARQAADSLLTASLLLVHCCMSITFDAAELGLIQSGGAQLMAQLQCCAQLLLGSGCSALERDAAILRGASAALGRQEMLARAVMCDEQLALAGTVFAAMQGLPEASHAQEVQRLLPAAPLERWLAAAVDVMGGLNAQHFAGPMWFNLQRRLAEVCSYIFTWGPFTAHQQQLASRAGSPARCALLRQLLLVLRTASVTMQLPSERRQHQYDWRLVANLMASLTWEPLLSSWQQLAAADDSILPAALQSTMQLLVHAPLATAADSAAPSDASTVTFCLIMSATALLGAVSSQLSDCMDRQVSAGGDSGRAAKQLQRIAPALLAPLMQQLSMAFQLVLDSRTALADTLAQFKMQQACRAANFCSDWAALLRLMQQVCDSWQGSSSTASGHTAAPAPQFHDAAGWCHAAVAGLRVLPMLSKLAGRFLQLAAVRTSEVDPLAFDQLASSIVALASCAALRTHGLLQSSIAAAGGGEPLPAGWLAGAGDGIWSLHTSACRLVHWAAAAASSSAASDGSCSQRDPDSADQMALPCISIENGEPVLSFLNWTFRAAAMLSTLAGSDQPQAAGQLGSAMQSASQVQAACQAMSMAHWEALRLLVPSASIQKWTSDAAKTLAFCVSLVVENGPAALAHNPGLHGLLAQLLQDKSHRLSVFLELSKVTKSPGLAAWLMKETTVSDLLATVGDAAAKSLGGRMMWELMLTVESASAAILEAASGSSGAGTCLHGQPEDAEVDMAIEQRLSAFRQAKDAAFQQAEDAVASGSERQQELQAMVVATFRDAVSAAERLAAALQTYWQLPQQQAAAQLELAQAAAQRSCAYLRCANLAAEGGPAAGQGAGSQKCSACRVAWYCGTACSHADWREGGHRRVCRALAAARQQQRQHEPQT